jgi:hypothetical protein
LIANNLQWLPNQLQAVLNQMIEIEPLCQKTAEIEEIMDFGQATERQSQEGC